MKKLLPVLAIAVIAIALVQSCSKNTYNPGTPSPFDPPLNQLFAGLRTSPQALAVNAGRDTMVFGAKGTMLHFYPKSFKDATGSTITSGVINLQIVEMYTPGDMIANRATTMSGSNLLTSGGQINLTATMNGQTVYTNKYGIGFIQSKQSNIVMTLFSGNTKNGDSVVNWVVGDTSKEYTKAWIGDTTQHPTIPLIYGRAWLGFVFDSASSLEYTNCDAFYSSDSPMVSINVVMPDGAFTPTNTQLYLVLPDINCAMSSLESSLGSASYDPTTKTIKLVNESQKNIVPAGMKYKLVVIANKNGQYYHYEQDGTIPHTGLTAKAVMNADSEASIKSMLSKL